ncbi:hypothetical protein PMIN06_006913 [Paraphaeosphaeria minitans]|uniref:SURP motif domain-containing protein n=1 Tax=Paraphaeosphaeria minitans TaxID=565426 RepID=A0A9P6KQU4_9PLEO|nr:hypothetical protein PMIN01_06880 [Paraphaeosphaeria minitans]
MAATNGDSSEIAANPPPNVIIPPKNVRESIAKTADFVHRRGERDEAALVTRVRDQGKSNMAFVLPEDTYNQYYAWYLQQLREGKGPSAATARAVADAKPQGPPEPPKFRFSARMPQINAKDLEILRLTALYTARVGENWLKELRNRESGNAQFEFLRPTHSFFPFFRALVEQYKILLEEEQTVEARIEELQRNIRNRFHVLDRAKGRAEYVKYVTHQREKEEKKAEDEKKEYAAIDWHDFGVIATVLFDEGDDAAELPPPTNLTDLQSASLEQKAMVSLSSKRLEEALPDDVTFYNTSQQPGMPPSAYPGMPPMAPPVQPAYAPPPAAPYGYQQPAPVDWQADEARQAREQQAERDQVARAQATARGAPGTMRIRTDYVPRGKKTNVTTVQCPNCKQMFPSDEIEEHMRIELLDPRWKEQRAKTEARYSTVITPNEAANNLKRFASQRDDIYDGATGVPITEEEAARRKKAATSYDGQPDSAKDAARIHQMQSMNLQDQLRRIHEKHGGGQ